MRRVADTNVVVRLLTADDPDQYRRACELFAEGHAVLLRTTVLLEAAWVLLKVYKMGTDEVIAGLSALTELETVVVEERVRMGRALELWRVGLDVADAFHVSAMPDEATFVTFDQRLERVGRRAGLQIHLL